MILCPLLFFQAGGRGFQRPVCFAVRNHLGKAHVLCPDGLSSSVRGRSLTQLSRSSREHRANHLAIFPASEESGSDHTQTFQMTDVRGYGPDFKDPNLPGEET